MLRIVVAPNSFKNSLSSLDVATCINQGLQQSGLGAEVKLLPIADGGDHTLDILVHHFEGELAEHTVSGPLGDKTKAQLGFIHNGTTAVVELAKASGLNLIGESGLDPMKADTFGTGELIIKALEQNVTRIIVGLGGSATVDGGTGLLRALGAKFLDNLGSELVPRPDNLGSCSVLDLNELHPGLQSVDITVLCDVENTLLGDEGAAAVFGPQKGADPDQVIELNKFLQDFALVVETSLKLNIRDIKYGGAAGGAGAGLFLLPSARLESGIEYMINLMDFKHWLDWADLLITAEGKLDMQTASGKGPMGIALLADKFEVPVLALAGQVEMGTTGLRNFDSVLTIGSGPKTLDQALASTARDLERTSLQIGGLLKRLL